MPLVLILPLIAGVIAQTLKVFIKSNKLNMSWQSLMTYSGMPSGHAAIVVALATITALEFGWASPLFAISFILAFLVIRDALGLRKYLGQHGKVLNDLVRDLGNDAVLDKHYPHLLEKIGHTPAQILAGGSIGLMVSLIGYWLLK